MNTVFIYTLSDPRNRLVRYVGKTRNPKQRRHNHFNSCRDKNTHKRNWINSVRKSDLLPIFEIIDEVEESDWIFWEKFWIVQFKSWGFELCNHTIGGEGLTQGNQTSFKKGNTPWNKGTAKPKILKGTKTWEHPNSVRTQFKVGHSTWNTGKTYKNLKTRKAVFQYSGLTGKLVAKWECSIDASRALNINRDAIQMCCVNRLKTSGGYIWSYIESPELDPQVYKEKMSTKTKFKLK